MCWIKYRPDAVIGIIHTICVAPKSLTGHPPHRRSPGESIVQRPYDDDDQAGQECETRRAPHAPGYFFRSQVTKSYTVVL